MCKKIRKCFVDNYPKILLGLFFVFLVAFIVLLYCANTSTSADTHATTNVTANVSVNTTASVTANASANISKGGAEDNEHFNFDGFGGGFATEVIVGGFFSLFSAVFASFVYLYTRRGKYYDDIVDFVNEVIQLRKKMEKAEEEKEEKKEIDKDQIQNLIISFSKTIPDEILAYTLDKNVTAEETPTKCKICTKEVQKTTTGKCKNCRLDCQAWELQE